MNTWSAFPKEGASAWADWYFKVRGTKHNDLADLFMNYCWKRKRRTASCRSR